MRAAINPVVTILGLDIGVLLGGAMLVETVFNIPGIGRLNYDAITHSDFPIVQGTVLLAAMFIIVANIVVDIALRLSRSAGALLVSAQEPLLRVEDLRVEFPTEDGVVHAVDGITYQVQRGRTLGIVGESGSGKTVSSLTTLGLTRRQGAQVSGRILFEGRDLLTLSEDELRSIRGNEIAMIFQDPLSSLHPLYKVGSAADRGDAGPPRRLQSRRRRRAPSSCWASSASPTRSAAWMSTRTSSPAACASAR